MRLEELNQFFSDYLCTKRYAPEEQGGIYVEPPFTQNRVIARLGLALEPAPGLADWLAENRIDALWLHRPWKLDRANFPEHIAVLAHHLPFDEQLTIGYNQPLASALGLTWTDEMKPAIIGFKQHPGFAERPIGMLVPGPDLGWTGWCRRIEETFGGYDEAEPGQQKRLNCLAVVGAMTDELVREADRRGAGLYLTGQFRKAGRDAVRETGMAVIAIGHRRSEEWGLRTLAAVLRKTGLSVAVWLPDAQQ